MKTKLFLMTIVLLIGMDSCSVSNEYDSHDSHEIDKALDELLAKADTSQLQEKDQLPSIM